MRFVRFRASGESAWGLLAGEGETILHIAGAFRAWSPRIAGGEGVHALPCTGRRYAQAEVELLAPADDGAMIYDGDAGLPAVARLSAAGPRPTGAPLGVALVGAPLVGRSSPLRSLFGHTLAWRSGDSLAISPIVTARALPSDRAPLEALAEGLASLETRHPLRPGDLVLFALTRDTVEARAA